MGSSEWALREWSRRPSRNPGSAGSKAFGGSSSSLFHPIFGTSSALRGGVKAEWVVGTALFTHYVSFLYLRNFCPSEPESSYIEPGLATVEPASLTLGR